VETGKYISPEFRLGHVWDGTAIGDETGGGGENGGGGGEDIVLYRPVYVRILEPKEKEKEKAVPTTTAGTNNRTGTTTRGEAAHSSAQPPAAAHHLGQQNQQVKRRGISCPKSYGKMRRRNWDIFGDWKGMNSCGLLDPFSTPSTVADFF
jgi:hypothetical protein